MAQHDYNLANAVGSVFRADANNVLVAIATNNAGASAPSTTFQYEWWIDESTNVLKIRNSANDDWITLPISITTNNTVDVNGGTIDGITQLSFSSGVNVTQILDEDSFASNSNTSLATQQSIKAYVDANVFNNELVDDRVANLLQDGTGISFNYDDANATLTPTISLSPFSTSNLSEGSNLYYTDARVDTRFATKDTNDLSEGTSNKYFTEDRVKTSLTNFPTSTDAVSTDSVSYTHLRAHET